MTDKPFNLTENKVEMIKCSKYPICSYMVAGYYG